MRTYKLYFIFFLLNVMCGEMFAQGTFVIKTKRRTPEHYLNLLKTDAEIRADDKLNETLINLAQCYVVDSVLHKKRQWHRVPGGFMLPLFGYFWEKIDDVKRKYVGTSKRNYVPSKPTLKEYDINFDIVPHLDYYIEMMYRGYMAQKKFGRMTKDELRNPPFIHPTPLTLQQYRLHCECTPPLYGLRDSLNQYFYPTRQGTSHLTHPNFEDDKPSIGMYGAYVSDCNHSGGPEIHPYEWIWWFDLEKEAAPTKHRLRDEDESSSGGAQAMHRGFDWQKFADMTKPDKQKDAGFSQQPRAWVIGLIKDSAGRHDNWVNGSRTGEINIPFVYEIKPTGADTFEINIEHLVCGEFDSKSFDENLRNSISPDALRFDFTEKKFRVENMSGRFLGTIKLKTNKSIKSNALRWWMSDLEINNEDKVITGRFHIALSVKDAYATKVIFK